MRLLLDTNVCVYAIKHRPSVIDRLQRLSPDDLAISAVTLAELWFGALKSSGERNLLIAATAKSRHLTVVTHNVAEFGRVPGLEVEDWM